MPNWKAALEHRVAEALQQKSRRYFLGNAGYGIGATALASLMMGDGSAQAAEQVDLAELANPLAPKQPHFAPKPSVASSFFSKVLQAKSIFMILSRSSMNSTANPCPNR